MAARVGLAEVRYGYAGENHLDARDGRVQPVLHVRPDQVHRLLALRAGLRRSAGHLRADRSQGRGFDSKVTPGGTDVPRLRVRLVRRLRAGVPDGALTEKSVIELGMPTRSVVTTCAYCGVGCSFRAEMQGRRAGRAHGAEQGRRRQPRPLVRQGPLRVRLRHAPRPHHDADDPRDDPRRVARVSWDEAFARVAPSSSASSAKYGVGSIGGITSSRCTNEEIYVVQKIVRAAFGNNNVDTCARVCHSPTGYGLKHDLRRLGGHAGLRLGRCRPTSCSSSAPTRPTRIRCSRRR